ncbi:MAG: phospholipase A [candidate division Zixibacteria bacterium]
MLKRLLISFILAYLPLHATQADEYFRSYRPNYFVLDFNGDAKFQVSQAMKLFQFQWGDHTHIPDLWASYSAKSFWDLSKESAPFRETNYNPDLFLDWGFETPDNGISLSDVKFGYMHESNGLAGPESRSWDRLFTEVAVTYYSDKEDRMIFYFRPWYVFKKSGLNSDIEDYCGSFEGVLVLKTHYIRWAFAGRLSKDYPVKYPRILIDITFKPRKDRMGFYFYGQIFDGYGESLINYKTRTTEFRLGIEIVK